MPRTKKECKQHFNENDKRIHTGQVVSAENGKKRVEHDVEIVEDVSGFYRKVQLKASAGEDSPWVMNVQGKPMITIEEYDMEIDLYIHNHKTKKKKKIRMDYGNLCDIVTAFQFMDEAYYRTKGIPGKTPVKMKNFKTVKLEKKP